MYHSRSLANPDSGEIVLYFAGEHAEVELEEFERLFRRVAALGSDGDSGVIDQGSCEHK